MLIILTFPCCFSKNSSLFWFAHMNATWMSTNLPFPFSTKPTCTFWMFADIICCHVTTGPSFSIQSVLCWISLASFSDIIPSISSQLRLFIKSEITHKACLAPRRNSRSSNSWSINFWRSHRFTVFKSHPMGPCVITKFAVFTSRSSSFCRPSEHSLRVKVNGRRTRGVKVGIQKRIFLAPAF